MEKNNFAVRLLYGTRAGRAFLEWLLKSNIDKVIVKFLWSPLSKPVIPLYIKMNQIPMKEFQGQKYRLKSQTMRKDQTELAAEVFVRNGDTGFAERMRDIDGVRDVTLIQYNGEYHG